METRDAFTALQSGIDYLAKNGLGEFTEDLAASRAVEEGEAPPGSMPPQIIRPTGAPMPGQRMPGILLPGQVPPGQPIPGFFIDRTPGGPSGGQGGGGPPR